MHQSTNFNKGRGQGIAEIRISKGLSQEDVSRRIKISRSSFAQIELGNRGIDIMELQALSLVLGFSLDDFMSGNFQIGNESDIIQEPKIRYPEERISVPRLQIGKFKNVLLYMLERCACSSKVRCHN